MAVNDDDVINGFPFAAVPIGQTSAPSPSSPQAAEAEEWLAGIPIQSWEPPIVSGNFTDYEMPPPLLMAGGLDMAGLAKELMPHVLAHLRSLAPAEPKAMAEAAAETPGLDALTLYALADWLEEKRFSGVAGKVRKLAIEDGDLFVLRHPRMLSSEARKNLRESWDRLFAERGQTPPVVIVLEEGMELSQFRVAKKADTAKGESQ